MEIHTQIWLENQASPLLALKVPSIGSTSCVLPPFVVVTIQSLSHVWLSATPWTAAHQGPFTISQSLSDSNPVSQWCYLTISLCHPVLHLLSIIPRIRVFSNESALHIRWRRYQSFSFSISPSNEDSAFISFRTDWFDLLAVQGTLKSLTRERYKVDGDSWRSRPRASAEEHHLSLKDPENDAHIVKLRAHID